MGYSQKRFEVFFDFGKNYPNDANETALMRWILKNPDANVYKVSGFCDSVDVSEMNIELSTKRIQSVLNFLKANKLKVNKNLIVEPNGKNFKQSKIQSENRKVVLEYLDVEAIKPSKNLTPTGTNLFGSKPIKDSIINRVSRDFIDKKVGDVVRLLKINFYLNSDEVLPDSYNQINELFEVLHDKPSMKVEIQGHICCNLNEDGMDLSRFRASFIVDYLVSLGIENSRLTFAGFGNSKPIFAIPEKNEQERIQNRRVEILIKQL